MRSMYQDSTTIIFKVKSKIYFTFTGSSVPNCSTYPTTCPSLITSPCKFKNQVNPYNGYAAKVIFTNISLNSQIYYFIFFFIFIFIFISLIFLLSQLLSLSLLSVFLSLISSVCLFFLLSFFLWIILNFNFSQFQF